jgi:hypothetical protein
MARGIEPARLVSETTSPENYDLRQGRAFACEMAMASLNAPCKRSLSSTEPETRPAPTSFQGRIEPGHLACTYRAQ